MTNQIDDGGSAFPLPPANIGANGEVFTSDGNGMSLRDYFAAKAMAAFIQRDDNESVGSASKRLGIDPSTYNSSIHWSMICSLDAYAMADAMLAERSKTTTH